MCHRQFRVVPEELKTIHGRIRRLQAVQVRVLKILGFIFHTQRNLCHLNLLVYCCKIPLFKSQLRNVVEILKMPPVQIQLKQLKLMI